MPWSGHKRTRETPAEPGHLVAWNVLLIRSQNQVLHACPLVSGRPAASACDRLSKSATSWNVGGAPVSRSRTAREGS
jgi:hypothetical protein